MAEDLPVPKSRKETYLAKAAGVEVESLPTPASREELYLNAIAEGGGGGGTSDFDQLTNRPKYNGTEMTSETNIPESTSYTAGDGINISAQDVISVVNTGKAKVLTTADYNYPTDNPTSVALWLLNPGMYVWDSSATVVYSRILSNNSPQRTYRNTAIVYSPGNNPTNAIRVKILNGDSVNGSNIDPTNWPYIDLLLWKATGKSADGSVSGEPATYYGLSSSVVCKDLNEESTNSLPLIANQGSVIRNMFIELLLDQTTFNTLWEEA